jgi:hypothetical protein
MPTKADDNTSGSIDDGQAVSVVFKLLSNHRRRVAIRYLDTQGGTTSVADLADYIALIEGEHTKERYTRICVNLVHQHLPMMSDTGLIEYDQDQGVVELRDQAEDVLPHLDLTADADLSSEAL